MPGPSFLSRWLPRRRLAIAAALAVSAIGALSANSGAALANCQPVAEAPGHGTGLMRASYSRATPSAPGSFLKYLHRAQGLPTAPPPKSAVEITYLGHSSFLIRTPKGVSAITDYNGYVTSPLPPDIVTMNHAHDSHYTDFIEPGVKHALRGWTTAGGGYPRHNLTYRDLRVRNVATNIRGIEGGMEFAGNSIFIFESNNLCIAHLGHLHHQLTDSHLARIGIVDVLLVAIDDGMTMPQRDYAEVIRALKPRIIIPMHVFDQMLLDQFLNLMEKQRYRARMLTSPTTRFSKRTLPRHTVVVFPGGGF